jgi:hypothetical protein
MTEPEDTSQDTELDPEFSTAEEGEDDVASGHQESGDTY